jgi:hypothetical protein
MRRKLSSLCKICKAEELYPRILSLNSLYKWIVYDVFLFHKLHDRFLILTENKIPLIRKPPFGIYKQQKDCYILLQNGIEWENYIIFFVLCNI